MSHAHSTLLAEELQDWKETLQFYLSETIRFEDQLTTFVRNQPPTERSRRAEYFLSQFTDEIHLLLHLQNLLKELEKEMADAKISPDDTEARDALRQAMLGSGKSFLELKYDYQNFLAKVAKAVASTTTY